MVMAGLFRVMPKRAGLDFIMRGKPIDSQKAMKWGLINESVKKDELDKKVDKLADELASLAPETMQFGLEAYEKQDSKSFDEALPYLKEQIAKAIQAGSNTSLGKITTQQIDKALQLVIQNKGS